MFTAIPQRANSEPQSGQAAFDDQTSTFIIPAGAGFQVIFCPGGRSTTILNSEHDQLNQLQTTGHVDDVQFLEWGKEAREKMLSAKEQKYASSFGDKAPVS